MTATGPAPPPRRPAALVVGGSAGALDALQALLAGLPDELTAPIAVVVHLPARRPARLVEVLAAACRRPVREAEDKEPLAASTVYVAAPDYHLLIDEGPAFALSVDEPEGFSRPAIDVLFESAADVLGADLVGVVLSGASADGARGLRAVREAGGLAIVQAPGEALNRTMPDAALALCPDAEVLPVGEIGRRLAGVGGPPREGPPGRDAVQQ